MTQQILLNSALNINLGNVFGVPGLDLIQQALAAADANFTQLFGQVGEAQINFGSAPGTNTATATITGQTKILSTSSINLWIQGTDSTVDHNAAEHTFVLPEYVTLTATAIVPGVSFTVTGVTTLNLTGNIAFRWSWR
jgi:hypothetical protein